MGRSNTHEKIVLKKGPWTREEDQKLLDYIAEHGHGSWRALPAKAGLQRCGKSCRLRWANYLRPDIKRGKFSPQEEKTIIRLHALLGNRWSAIATHLPKRTDNEIKNYWNTRLKKRLTRMGIDPATHKHKDNLGNSSSAVVSHMAQWETARLEAEARLVRECKAKVASTAPAPPTHPLPPPCLDVLKVWEAISQCGFFSPTSTPNSSGSRVLNENGYLQAKGKTDNLPELVNAHYSMDYDDAVKRMITGGSMEIQTINCDGYHNCGTSACVGDFEDNKNYWNELFNLVNSPTL